jgi:hypothetical protein
MPSLRCDGLDARSLDNRLSNRPLTRLQSLGRRIRPIGGGSDEASPVVFNNVWPKMKSFQRAIADTISDRSM